MAVVPCSTAAAVLPGILGTLIGTSSRRVPPGAVLLLQRRLFLLVRQRDAQRHDLTLDNGGPKADQEVTCRVKVPVQPQELLADRTGVRGDLPRDPAAQLA